MNDLSDYGIDEATLRRMYDEWCQGAKKSELERRYLGKPESHGALFTGLVRNHLGIETQRRSPQAARLAELTEENARLRDLLESHGIDPAGL